MVSRPAGRSGTQEADEGKPLDARRSRRLYNCGGPSNMNAFVGLRPPLPIDAGAMCYAVACGERRREPGLIIGCGRDEGDSWQGANGGVASILAPCDDDRGVPRINQRTRQVSSDESRPSSHGDAHQMMAIASP